MPNDVFTLALCLEICKPVGIIGVYCDVCVMFCKLTSLSFSILRDDGFLAVLQNKNGKKKHCTSGLSLDLFSTKQ